MIAQDPQYAAEQLTEHEQHNAAIVKWKVGGKQYASLAWQEENGHRLQDSHISGTTPFEKEEWILRQIRKKGSERKDCIQKWNEYEADNFERDYKGDKGQLRLWLPKKESKDQQRQQYMDFRSQSNSENIKNPDSADVHALSMFVHAKATACNFQHAFFKGGSGVPYISEASAENAHDEGDRQAAAQDGDQDAGERQAAAQGSEQPPKKLKGNIIKLRTSFNKKMCDTLTQVLCSFMRCKIDRQTLSQVSVYVSMLITAYTNSQCIYIYTAACRGLWSPMCFRSSQSLIKCTLERQCFQKYLYA